MRWLLLFALLFGLSITTIAQQKIWIDTDIMMGKFRRDVDDGLALILALNSDSVEIVGISLVMDVDYGFEVTTKLINWYGGGKQIPVYKGATGAHQLGADNEAVQAMTKAFKKESMVLVALGPATNIATMLKRTPSVADSIKQIVFCMGRQPGMHFNPGKEKFNFNDYNFDLDTLAMEQVLEFDIPIVCAGYEASSSVFFNKEDIRVFNNKNNPGNKWVHKQLKQWATLWKLFVGTGKKGFIPFDAIAIGYVIAPEYFTNLDTLPLEIRVYDNDTKHLNKNKQKPYLVVDSQSHAATKAIYCYPVSGSYKSYLLEQYSRLTQIPDGK